MSIKFNTIAIIGTHHNPLVEQTVSDVYDYLTHLDLTILVEKETADSFPGHQSIHGCSFDEIAQTAELAIVVGGDGNFLNAARKLAKLSNNHIPITGINRGKLGFLADINPDEIKTRLNALLNGHYTSEKRFILKTEVVKNKIKTGTMTAVNDIVLSSGHSSRLFEFWVSIDNQYAFSQRSDGIIIATPTGSTAHALSAGGSILYPSLNVIELVPMFAHSLTSRPIVVSAECAIEITIADYNNPQPLVSFDGHCHSDLSAGDQIKISKDKTELTILHPTDYSYYQTLRQKLHWSRLLFE
ncbi:NAD(+) kinase [Thiotrichales bacterium 19S3-7]|nr:NAD(+) kinase [Thiotrichales bacterium 19S3-7]MCF6801110.1 NAD(+) kinase [Thiotrichales bacterium 19S3-11]